MPKGAKAQTKKKRGRPAADDVLREPNGRRSRGKGVPGLPVVYKGEVGLSPKKAVEVAVEARCRLYGLTEDEAGHQEAGSVVGRLELLGRRGRKHPLAITAAQRMAAERYMEARGNHLRAIMARSDIEQKRPASAGDGVSKSYEAWCKGAIVRWLKVEEAIEDVAIMHRHENVFAAVDCLIVRDELHEHMVPALRLALVALTKVFGIDEGREAA